MCQETSHLRPKKRSSQVEWKTLSRTELLPLHLRRKHQYVQVHRSGCIFSMATDRWNRKQLGNLAKVSLFIRNSGGLHLDTFLELREKSCRRN